MSSKKAFEETKLREYVSISSVNTVSNQTVLTITRHSSDILIVGSQTHELTFGIAVPIAISLKTRGEWDAFCSALWKDIQPNTSLDMSLKK